MDHTQTPWRALEDAPLQQVEANPSSKAPSNPRIVIPSTAIVALAGALLLTVAAFLLAAGTGSGGQVSVENGNDPGTTASALNRTSSMTPSVDAAGSATGGPTLIVEIIGAVEHPGVFRIAGGSRIGDLVTAAGGYSPRVDADRAGRSLNLAAQLHDGDQIRVPSRGEQAPSTRPVTSGPGPNGTTTSPVDLNHASPTDLDALPGIGPVTAAKIIASREEQPFGSVQDLRTRKLVGEKTFMNLKDLVTVG